MSNNEQSIEAVHQMMNSMIDGLPKMPAGITSLTVLGTTYTLADLKTKIETYEYTYAKADVLKRQAKEAMQARDAVGPETREFIVATKAALKAALGKSAAGLETVGVTPNKMAPSLTNEQMADRIAKAKATRAARHTMGSKQRSKIKGQVPTGGSST